MVEQYKLIIKGEDSLKYEGICIAVDDIKLARKFYEDLFGLEVFQDYGINIVCHGCKSIGTELT